MSCFKKQVPPSSSTRGNDRAKEWKRKREPGPVELEKIRENNRTGREKQVYESL